MGRTAEALKPPPATSSRSGWRGAYVLSGSVALLAGLASFIGLLVDGVYAGPGSVTEMLRGYDLVTLVVAVPALVLAQRQARRGSQRGQVVWVGVLAYLAYTYAFYSFGTGFNDIFVLHAAVFGGSVFALVLSVPALDTPVIGAGFAPRMRRRLVAVVLGLLAAGLGGMWLYHSLRFAVTGEVPAGSALVEPDNVVHLGIALDLALLVPAYALAAVLLWRGIPAGFLLASVVLVAGTLHQISYLVALPFQAAAGIPGAVAFDPMEPVIAVLFAVATILLLAQADGDRTSLLPRPALEVPTPGRDGAAAGR